MGSEVNYVICYVLYRFRMTLRAQALGYYVFLLVSFKCDILMFLVNLYSNTEVLIIVLADYTSVLMFLVIQTYFVRESSHIAFLKIILI